MKNIGRMLKRAFIAISVLVVLGAVAYGSHWATTAYAESRDEKIISDLREQVDNYKAAIAKQNAKVSETFLYMSEYNREIITEAKGNTFIIKVVGDRAQHHITDGEDKFILNDTTHDPIIKER